MLILFPVRNFGRGLRAATFTVFGCGSLAGAAIPTVLPAGPQALYPRFVHASHAAGEA